MTFNQKTKLDPPIHTQITTNKKKTTKYQSLHNKTINHNFLNAIKHPTHLKQINALINRMRKTHKICFDKNTKGKATPKNKELNNSKKESI